MKSILKNAISFLLIFTLLAQYCFANIDKRYITEPYFSKILNILGATYKLHDDELTITIDANKAIESTQIFKEAGYYKSWVTPQMVAAHPIFSSKLFSLTATSVVIPRIYHDYPNLDKIYVNVFLIHQDIYGNDTKEIFFAFEFNNELNNKINWVKFDINNASSIYPNFTYSNSNWLTNALYAEANIPWRDY